MTPNKPQSLEALREKLILLLEEYRYDGGRPLVSGEMDIPSEILLECLEWWAAQPLPKKKKKFKNTIEYSDGTLEVNEYFISDAGYNQALEDVAQQQRDLITKAKKELK